MAVCTCHGFLHSLSEELAKDVEFEVVGDEVVGPKPSEQPAKNIANGSDDGAQPSTSTGKQWQVGGKVQSSPVPLGRCWQL